MKIDIPSTIRIERETIDREGVDVNRAANALLTAYREEVAKGTADVVDVEPIRDVLVAIVQYTTGAPEFLKNPIVRNAASFNKGLWLKGHYGTGKTTILRAAVNMARYCSVPNPVRGRVVSCHEVTRAAESDEGVLHLLAGARGIIIDDLGREDTVYGKYPAKSLIETAYIKRVRLHSSTNYTRDQLAAMYGDGVRDRIFEMCNVIQMPNTESFRK